MPASSSISNGVVLGVPRHVARTTAASLPHNGSYAIALDATFPLLRRHRVKRLIADPHSLFCCCWSAGMMSGEVMIRYADLGAGRQQQALKSTLLCKVSANDEK